CTGGYGNYWYFDVW
nr:immunoglobulin heavy chain junction region [Mus musculus]